MNHKNAARLAWALCLLVIIAAFVSSVYALRDRPANDNIIKMGESVVTFIMFVAFGVTGALIISHQPRNVVGWLLMIEATLVFVWPLDTYFNNLAQAPANASFLTLMALWLYGWMWLWYIFPLLFIPLFFPTGKPLTPRWRWVVVLGIGLCLYFILFITFSADFGHVEQLWLVPNPIGFLSPDNFSSDMFAFLLFAFSALCVVSLLVRYRRAQKMEREQIKWLLYTAVLVFVLYMFNNLDGAIGDLLRILFTFAILLLPASIAVAILRYRLYDIDVIIRKTLVYTVLTGFLALAYFGTVILLQSLLGQATDEQSPLIIVFSTLLIAALFTPLRRRIQAVIDRRFFRKKYDAQQVLAQFAQTARDETDMEALQAELLRVVQETMQPEGVSLWLREPRR